MNWYKLTFFHGGTISIEAENWAEAVKLGLNIAPIKTCEQVP